jgi:hypothetical protein
MKCITNRCDKENNLQVFAEAETKYNIQIRDDIKEFLIANSGGYPVRDLVTIDGEEYEIRVFLSLDDTNKDYYIEKPLAFFLENTKKKIVPIGIDSGDNYYCVNNETGKVYYWSSSDNKYYLLKNSLKEFMVLFE